MPSSVSTCDSSSLSIFNPRRLSPRNSSSSTHTLTHSSPRHLVARGDCTIREGNDFQAPVEDLDVNNVVTSPAKSDDNYPDRDQCLWRPPSPSRNTTFDDSDLMKYCRLANERFSINIEQSLFLLYLKNYDLEVAKSQLSKHVAISSRFSDDDLNAFRFAYSCYGKNFVKIQQMMPHKSLKAIVQHYYNTKKYQLYKSTIDLDGGYISDGPSNVEALKMSIMEELRSMERGSEGEKKHVRISRVVNKTRKEDKDEPKPRMSGVKADAAFKGQNSSEPNDELQNAEDTDKLCENCKSVVQKVYTVHELDLCKACKVYFIINNRHRPYQLPDKPRRQVKCPPDMRKIAFEFVYFMESADDVDFENADDTGDLQIACERETRCEAAIREKKREISKMRAEAKISEMKAKKEFTALESFASSSVLAQARMFLERTAPPKARLQYSWEESEKMMAFHGLVSNECDFASTAELLGTKSADMVKSFYHEECKNEVDELIDEARKLQFDTKKRYKYFDYDEEFNKLIKEPEVIEIDDD